ncbi:DUF4105 domain-containing protein [Lujinxingia vulgaris]|uniref:DUF4105 domain-containing protein n=1 Tax=Lujinxingia vulgaris TaxID=2600176 RepID=A0A5C6XE71_9DELT|nr:DUF4105 domain-containing protein [Lujinxingia vulgaris]TXD38109.1 DUF4105 domain-containing protein [Lujinxingia vulgaris]
MSRSTLPLLALLTLGALLHVACASAPPPREPASWPDDAPRAVEALASSHIFAEPGPWLPGELDMLAQAAAHIPAVLRPDASEPLYLQRRTRPCLFGIGRYTEACPTFSEDGRTFYIYDMVLMETDGPLDRQRALTRPARQRLWRQRAIAHALVARADKAHALSQTYRWRSINGWDDAGARPRNRDLHGYLRPLGKGSAHLDFVTSAEAFFFREEDLIELDPQLGTPVYSPDLTFSCQEFTRNRVLADFFDDLDPQWRQGTWRADDPATYDCPAFERWADVDNLMGVDVLFAAERTDRPESLFGHLLIHVRHRSAELFRSQGFEYVYQFGAVTDSDIHPLRFVLEGMAGGFLAVFDLSTFRGIDRTYLQLEQRTLRRYPLALSKQQTRQLLERIWEVERRFAYPYFFTTHNCASFLIDLIGPALDREEPLPRKVFAMPTEVLDILAGVTTDTGEPLLSKPDADVLSAEERAILASERIEAIAARFVMHPAAPEELAVVIDALRRGPPDLRAGRYDDLLSPLEALISRAPELADEAAGLYDAFIALETSELQLVEATLLEFEERAQLEPLRFSAAEILALRRELYRHERAGLRARQRNEFLDAVQEHLRRAPREDPTRAEERALDWHALLLDAHHAASQAQGELIDWLVVRDLYNPRAALREREARFATTQVERSERSLRTSNAGRWGVTLSADGQALPPTSAPRLHLDWALLDDHLGERRLHGHRPEVEATALGLRASAPLTADALQNLELDFTLFRYISIATPRAGSRRGFTDRFGWALELDARHIAGELPMRAHGFFGLVLPIARSDSGTSLLALGAGPALDLNVGRTETAGLAGGQAYLLARAHLGGYYANALDVRVRHAELFNILNLHSERNLSARLGVTLTLALGPHAMLFQPYSKLEYVSGAFAAGSERTDLEFGLRLELVRDAF